MSTRIMSYMYRMAQKEIMKFATDLWRELCQIFNDFKNPFTTGKTTKFSTKTVYNISTYTLNTLLHYLVKRKVQNCRNLRKKGAAEL